MFRSKGKTFAISHPLSTPNLTGNESMAVAYNSMGAVMRNTHTA
jgi:hypothetical protein